MFYSPDTNLAYDSVIYICRDVNGGWLFRRLHTNLASFLFFFIFLHIGRGIYYQRYKSQPLVWLSGVCLLLLTMATAFIGYVLPWGQIRLWGATVITNLLRAIPYVGLIIVEWIWGSFSVGRPTLHRFYSLHFILPFLIILFSLVHLLFLHCKGSTNPLGDISKIRIVNFSPYYSWKDIFGFLIVLISLLTIVLFKPFWLGDPENFNPGNSIVTPAHIIPEWYFLFAYAILRVVPRKLGGVIALMFSITFLLLIPLTAKLRPGPSFNPIYQLTFWIFVSNFLLLIWLGGQEITYPYDVVRIWRSTVYFFRIGALIALS